VLDQCSRKRPHRLLLLDAGHIGAHQREICPEALRTAEISVAGHAICLVHPLRSEGSPHKTGLQAVSPPSMPLTCGAIVTAFHGSVPGADGNE
jgi:hypothetical protein